MSLYILGIGTAVPGGYGGMVHSDGGRVSLSCCIRRDELSRIRGQHPGSAGDAVLARVQQDYADLWRRNSARRIWASSAIAHLPMRPAAVSLSLPLVCAGFQPC